MGTGTRGRVLGTLDAGTRGRGDAWPETRGRDIGDAGTSLFQAFRYLGAARKIASENKGRADDVELWIRVLPVSVENLSLKLYFTHLTQKTGFVCLSCPA